MFQQTAFLVLASILLAPVVARAAPAQPGEPPEPPAAILALLEDGDAPLLLSAHDVIHDKIDVHAQFTLKRLSEREAMGPRIWSNVVLSAVDRNTIAGIYLENQGVPALRARAKGGNWWEILDEGEAVVCYQIPAEEAPLLVIDDAYRSNAAVLDRALVVAFQECGFGWLILRVKGEQCSVQRAANSAPQGRGGRNQDCSGPSCRHALVLPAGSYDYTVTCGGVTQKRSIPVPADGRVRHETFSFETPTP